MNETGGTGVGLIMPASVERSARRAVSSKLALRLWLSRCGSPKLELRLWSAAFSLFHGRWLRQQQPRLNPKP
jgi:hypothetical protein